LLIFFSSFLWVRFLAKDAKSDNPLDSSAINAQRSASSHLSGLICGA
jgi:hypothetical protein